MIENEETGLSVSTPGAVQEAETALPAVPLLTEQAIADIKRNIMMCERLVNEVLEAGVDYGKVPGVAEPFLQDPGAGKIMAAFNLYAEHHILSERLESGLISYLIAARLVHRESGRVVAEGIGAASTEETKHKYRWVKNPEDYGYHPDDFQGRAKRKAKDGSGDTEYHIPNPERGELQHVVASMAAKRAEKDACQSLPGVGSTLRKLFSRKYSGKGGHDTVAVTIKDFNQFWSETRRLGWPDSDSVHQALKVGSIKVLLDKGQTLDQIIQKLRNMPPPTPKPTEDIPGLSAEDEESPPEELPPEDTTPPATEVFWQRLREIGFSKDYALEILSITRGKRSADAALRDDWLMQGKTLNDALIQLNQHVGSGRQAKLIE